MHHAATLFKPCTRMQGAATPATVSPFACIGATMGYSTFHMLQTLWLGVIDLPTNSSEKDWDLQARRLWHYVCVQGHCVLLTSQLAPRCLASAVRKRGLHRLCVAPWCNPAARTFLAVIVHSILCSRCAE